MKKTINFTEKEIEKITNYKNKLDLKTFSSAIKNIIANLSNDNDISDDKFALLADAIIKLDKKIEEMSRNIAPKSAGEVKR